MSPDKVKDAVLERDGYKCVECGMTNLEHFLRRKRSLEVHRIVPGSQYTIEGCVTLCRPCHDRKPKSPRGSGIFDGTSYCVFIPQPLYALMKLLSRKNRRRIQQEFLIACEDHLRQAGLTPAPPPEPRS